MCHDTNRGLPRRVKCSPHRFGHAIDLCHFSIKVSPTASRFSIFRIPVAQASFPVPLGLDVIAPITGVTGDAANSVAQQLGAGSLGASVLRLVPRFGFPSSLAAAIGGSSSDQTGYGIGIGIQFAYGLVLAILTLLVGCCFCWCRCCCNWCGAREPLEGGYTKCQRWGTWLLMLVFTLAVVALCVFGWYNNNQLTQSAVGPSTGLFDIVKNLLGNTIFFLDGTVAQVGTAIPASQPPITVLLGTVKTQIPTAVTNIQGLLAQTGFLFVRGSSVFVC